MFFIQKKLPRPHGPNEPLLYPDHKVPMTRRELLGAGLRSAPALVIGPAWLAAALKPNKANAALSADIQALLGQGPVQRRDECDRHPGDLLRSRRWRESRRIGSHRRYERRPG